MPQCEFPDCERKEAFPFKCSYCGKSFCSKHRLPENHDCDQLHLGKSPLKADIPVKIITKTDITAKSSETPSKDKRFTTYDFNDDDSHVYGTDSDGNIYSIKQSENQTFRQSILAQVGDAITTGKEFLDISIGVLIIILSFGFTAILMTRLPWLYTGFLIGIILVSYLSTILPQKLLARRFGCTSRYTLTKIGLIVSIITIIIPVKYISPGMLLIPEIDFIEKKKSGLLSAIGSFINLSLGLVFIFLGIFLPNYSIALLMLTGAFITSQITLLRLIPMRFLPGKRILNWSWPLFTVMLVLALGIFILSILFGVMGVRIISI